MTTVQNLRLCRTNLKVGAETITPSQEYDWNKRRVTDLHQYICMQYRSRLYAKVTIRPEFSGTVPGVRLTSQTNFVPNFVPLYIFPILFRLPYNILQNGGSLGYCQRLYRQQGVNSSAHGAAKTLKQVTVFYHFNRYFNAVSVPEQAKEKMVILFYGLYSYILISLCHMTRNGRRIPVLWPER